MSFSVSLDIFRGPVDLLLYLIRKQEVDIMEISLQKIVQQFLEYVNILEYIDYTLAGDFIAMISLLMEMKSFEVFPGNDEVEEEVDNTHEDLVHQLLQYKEYRDAAYLLEERSRRWQQNYARLSNDCPPRERDLAEEPIMNVELWDLVSAFGRIIQEAQVNSPTTVIYDETPIYTHMQRIQQRIQQQGSTTFSELFSPGMHKTTMVGIFLATLELVRHFHVLVEQYTLFGEIWLHPGESWNPDEKIETADEYSNNI
ncbi:MAG: segregation/condensation protein A [Planctomycetia bacterium]|nr:segregation/condensation protein A [Planctomycetia bacterium]